MTTSQMSLEEAVEWCHRNCATVEFQSTGYVDAATGEPMPSNRVLVSVTMLHGQIEYAGESFLDAVDLVADAHNLWKERGA